MQHKIKWESEICEARDSKHFGEYINLNWKCNKTNAKYLANIVKCIMKILGISAMANGKMPVRRARNHPIPSFVQLLS